MAPYFLRNLLPRKEHTQKQRPLSEVIPTITLLQWTQFFSGWISWTCDALDFFSVVLSFKHIAGEFNKADNDVARTITLTLLFRSVGAVVFGVLSDRFGRKWPLVANLLLIASLEIGVALCPNFTTFIALRSLFGIGMGGIWGMAASTALENLPVEFRGIASGVIQQGYAAGYFIAALLNLFLVPKVKIGWRVLFFAAAGMSTFSAILRAFLPESEVFLRARAAEKEKGESKKKTKIFLKEITEMLRTHWLLCVYAILLMTGFSFLSHGSQDLYPTYLTETKGFSDHDASIATMIGNCSAIAGGIFAGWLSQNIGRRLTIILHVTLVGVFIPLWILPTNFSGLAAGVFFLQFGVQGAWGVIPILLAELSPPAFRATFPGVSYQLGNMISAASSQIETIAGNKWKVTVIENGVPKSVADYAKIQGLLIGCVVVFVIFITIIGPENHGSHFEAHKTAFEVGAAQDDAVIEEEMLRDMSDSKQIDHKA